MSTPVTTTGRMIDAIWMEFDLTEDGKKAKCTLHMEKGSFSGPNEGAFFPNSLLRRLSIE